MAGINCLVIIEMYLPAMIVSNEPQYLGEFPITFSICRMELLVMYIFTLIKTQRIV